MAALGYRIPSVPKTVKQVIATIYPFKADLP